MVVMASGIACESVHMTTTMGTESHKMVANTLVNRRIFADVIVYIFPH